MIWYMPTSPSSFHTCHLTVASSSFTLLMKFPTYSSSLEYYSSIEWTGLEWIPRIFIPSLAWADPYFSSLLGSAWISLLFSFFLKIYLFIHERHRLRERERQRHRQREKQAPRREPDVGPDPGSWDHDLSWRQVPNHWATQASQYHSFLNKNITLLITSLAFF